MSIGAALGVGQFAPLSPHPVAEFLATQPPREFVELLLILLPQLLGEELLTMLPFLAILQLIRRSRIALALRGSTLLFSASHLPTYDWNWAQCWVVVGAARVVWTLAYSATRSLWVSLGAHILTDWATFLLAFLSARLFLLAILGAAAPKLYLYTVIRDAAFFALLTQRGAWEIQALPFPLVQARLRPGDAPPSAQNMRMADIL